MAERTKSPIVTGVIFTFLIFLGEVCVASSANVAYLQPGEILNCRKKDQPGLGNFNIYCYEGHPEHLLNMFQSAFIKINISTDAFELYEGGSPKEVEEQYAKDQSSWSFSPWNSPRTKEVRLKPFNETCIGISSKADYTLHLVVLRISYWRLIVMAVGAALFFMAPKLGRNTVFHYLSGVTLGVAASFLVLVFIVGKMFPRKSIMCAFMASGWMVGVYLLNLVWDNMRHIATQYHKYIMGYVFLSATLSFLFCYRMGPVTNHRTFDILQWGIQGIGLGLVFFSSHFQAATIAIIILMLSVYNFPALWWARMKTTWKRRFPPSVRHLTSEEYYEEGVRETRAALVELKNHCNSPEASPWKMVLRLKDPIRVPKEPRPVCHLDEKWTPGKKLHSPRFAQFMEGESHLNDSELMEYEAASEEDDDLLTEEEDD